VPAGFAQPCALLTKVKVQRRGRDVAFAINEHETAELLDIEAALLRIKEGVYGLCVNCGTHIPAVRLDAAPHTQRCVTCQTSFEQAHPV
jgi:DnaK suppressor protein